MLAAALVLCACEQTTVPVPSPTTQPPTVATPPPSRATTTHTLALGNGLVIDLPLAWNMAPSGSVNRGTYRLLFAGNGDLTGLATLPGNGEVDVAGLPNDRVVVEVEVFCRLSCSGPTMESALPLDWSGAAPLTPTTPSGRQERALGFRWFDQPMFLIARWSDGAPAADIAAIERVARSVRPDPPPPTLGEYRGWDGIGPLSAIDVGSVALRPLPTGAVVRPDGQIYDNVPYFVVRGKLNVYAFASKPLVDQRCEIQFDAAIDRFWCQVESRRYEWTRFGRYLGPEPLSDLVQHRVIVREGQVWVRYVEGSLLVPSVQDEAAER